MFPDGGRSLGSVDGSGWMFDESSDGAGFPVSGAASGESTGASVSVAGEPDVVGDGFPGLVTVPVAGVRGDWVEDPVVPGACVSAGVPGACVPAGVPGAGVEAPVVRGGWVEDPVVRGGWVEDPVVPGAGFPIEAVVPPGVLGACVPAGVPGAGVEDPVVLGACVPAGVPGAGVEAPVVPGAGLPVGAVVAGVSAACDPAGVPTCDPVAGFPGPAAGACSAPGGAASTPGASALPVSGAGLEGVVWVVDATSCPGSLAGTSVVDVTVDTSVLPDGSPDNASSALCLPPHPATTRRSVASRTQHSTAPTRLDVDPVSA